MNALIASSAPRTERARRDLDAPREMLYSSADRPSRQSLAALGAIDRSSPTNGLAPHIFATTSVPIRNQHEAWREWLRPLFEVLPSEPTGEGFVAEHRIWRVGPLTVSKVSGPPVEVAREDTHLRRAPMDHWLLGFCRSGASVIETRGIATPVPARTPYLLSLGETLRATRTATERMEIFLPRDSFHDLAPILDAAVGSVANTPLGTLLRDFMLSLEGNLPHLAATDLGRLPEVIGGLAAACLAPSARWLPHAERMLALGRMERLRRAVRENLRSPALSPASLCRMVGVSRSQLYRLLEGAGGIARYVQRQRLLEAHRVLSDAAIVTPVFKIAEDFCFEDASSFSRAFRREFGLSPTDVRAAALAGVPEPATLTRSSASEPTSFAALLRAA